jgi:hypothetical protein
VICDLKTNRTLNGRPLRTYAQLVRHQRYDRTTLRATDGDQTSSTPTVCGHLRGLGAPVIVLPSRRHPRDHHLKSPLRTDHTVTAQEILTLYAARWGSDLDYFRGKIRWGVKAFACARSRRSPSTSPWPSWRYSSWLYAQGVCFAIHASRIETATQYRQRTRPRSANAGDRSPRVTPPSTRSTWPVT